MRRDVFAKAASGHNAKDGLKNLKVPTCTMGDRILWLGNDGKIVIAPKPPKENLLPESSSLVVSNDGRCTASLIDGVLQPAWLNRYDPHYVAPWEKSFTDDRLKGARLTGIRLIYGDSVVIKAVTPDAQTIQFTCFQDRRGLEIEEDHSFWPDQKLV